MAAPIMPAMPTCAYLEEAALFVVAVDFVPVEVLVEFPDAVAAAPVEVAPVLENKTFKWDSYN